MCLRPGSCTPRNCGFFQLLLMKQQMMGMIMTIFEMIPGDTWEKDNLWTPRYQCDPAWQS